MQSPSGESCRQHLFKGNCLLFHRGLWILAAPPFAVVRVDPVRKLPYTVNPLMAVPNLIGLLLLVPMVFKFARQCCNDA